MLVAALAGLGTLTPWALAAAQDAQPKIASGAPQVQAARIAGDRSATRLVFDLDQSVSARAFPLADPPRVVVDLPQVEFRLPPETGAGGRGLIKAFRYGLVMIGGSRIVMDLTEPARIVRASIVPPEKGEPTRLVIELAATSRTQFLADVAAAERSVASATGGAAGGATSPPSSPNGDSRPLVVLDPGHGGIDTGTVAASGEYEKAIVLDFALGLRDHLEKHKKYRVMMTRADDTFLPLGERVRIARNAKAALFVSLHADALPRHEGDAQGATVYTLSEKASDAEAERLAESENRVDVLAGINATDEPAAVADILVDLTQRETRLFSSRFAKLLVQELKPVARLHRNPMKSAGFRVLRAHDVPSVLIELGYVSNRDDLSRLKSNEWRAKTVASVAQAIDGFFAARLVAR